MMVKMAVLSITQCHLGVEDTTMMSSTLWLCAALVMVAIALVETMEEKKKMKAKKRRMKAKKMMAQSSLSALANATAPTSYAGRTVSSA